MSIELDEKLQELGKLILDTAEKHENPHRFMRQAAYETAFHLYQTLLRRYECPECATKEIFAACHFASNAYAAQQYEQPSCEKCCSEGKPSVPTKYEWGM